jgi:putative Holliday junction resolvase
MARIMAIDYGSKRVGIAVTDPLQIIVSALDTVSPNELLKYFEIYFQREEVEKLVVGMPYNHGYEENIIVPQINNFIKVFSAKFPLVKVETYDERFTSKIASKIILQSGVNKKARQNKATLDKVSAVILLQSYLGY